MRFAPNGVAFSVANRLLFTQVDGSFRNRCENSVGRWWMSKLNDPGREFLRHCVATVAYRGGKMLRGAPATFAAFRGSDTTRTPAKILAHMGDLFDWALATAQG